VVVLTSNVENLSHVRERKQLQWVVTTTVRSRSASGHGRRRAQWQNARVFYLIELEARAIRRDGLLPMYRAKTAVKKMARTHDQGHDEKIRMIFGLPADQYL
jgi:hypothetical protein